MTTSVHDSIDSATAARERGDSEDLPSLLRLSLTWSVIGWWTAAYGALSWLVEYASARVAGVGAMPFLSGLNRVVYAVVWAGAIVVAIVLTDRWPIERRSQIGRIALHLAATLLVTVLWGVAAYYLCLVLVPGWVPLGVPRMLSTTAKNVLFGYGVLVVLMHIIWRVRRYRAQEVALLRQARLAAEVQLQALKMELQPHFLFNALHSISALMHTDVRAANETLVRLSDMLRHAVETSRVQEVSLRDELAVLQLYTEIEQVRFGDRLRLTWDVVPEVLDAVVPHMLLQPLIENAIKHALEVRSDAGKITVTARRDGDMLCLNIRDDGPGLESVSPRRGTGLGIANVRSRLVQLYGDRHAFRLSNAPGGGTEVVIELPLAMQRPADTSVSEIQLPPARAATQPSVPAAAQRRGAA